MKYFYFTRSESRWLSLFSLFAVLITAFFFVRPILPDRAHTHEPLADPTALSLLAQGKVLPTPADEREAVFHGVAATPPPLQTLLAAEPAQGVLGHSSLARHIEVDLTNQKVYAIEEGRRIYEFSVSTGKWAPTPTGEFRIWAKVRSQKMSGGVPGTGTYYYLPNVPWVMFFYNKDTPRSRGFSLHGTYWHNNFGHPMSHGCVNMRIEDAKTLYEWADPVVVNTKAWSTNASAENPGTKVIIYGEAPKE